MKYLIPLFFLLSQASIPATVHLEDKSLVDAPHGVTSALGYSTYLGGSGDEIGLGAAVDDQGNFYVVGNTTSSDFPTTSGSAQNRYGGGQDAFLIKVDASGSLVYSTYLGGSGLEDARGVAVDRSGNIYVLGYTESNDFPALNAFDSTLGGSRDVFLTKLNSSGQVLFSTYFGGSGTDTGLALAIDPSGDAYISGETGSADFPVTPEAYDRSWNGDVDAFAAKFNGAGELVYSTFLGSPGFDDGLAIAVDDSGEAFITGKASPGFPVTPGAFDTTPNGGFDMFVTKLDSSGSSLVYSTYLGGDNWDEGLGIAVDAEGNSYVTGNIQSSNFPVTPGAYQTNLRGTVNAAAVKINPSGSGLVYSTLLGGNTEWTEADNLSIDGRGDVYIAGHLGSPDYPVLPDSAFQPVYGGNVDGFVAKFDPTGSSLLYSSYAGGSGWDGAMTSTSGRSGNVYLSGGTSSQDFPLTADAFQRTNAGGYDLFLTKVPTAAPGGDSIPPTVSITSPRGVKAGRSTQLVVSAEAADNVGVVGVQFKLDGRNLGSEVTNPPYRIIWGTNDVTSGLHTLTAVARDAAGNVASSRPIVIRAYNGLLVISP